MITHIYYAHLASVRFEHSVCRGSLMTTNIYIYIYIYMYMIVKKKKHFFKYFGLMSSSVICKLNTLDNKYKSYQPY